MIRVFSIFLLYLRGGEEERGLPAPSPLRVSPPGIFVNRKSVSRLQGGKGGGQINCAVVKGAAADGAGDYPGGAQSDQVGQR